MGPIDKVCEKCRSICRVFTKPLHLRYGAVENNRPFQSNEIRDNTFVPSMELSREESQKSINLNQDEDLGDDAPLLQRSLAEPPKGKHGVIFVTETWIMVTFFRC